MKSPEKTGHLKADEIILPEKTSKHILGETRQKMTTFWVSPTTWKHVQEQRELGETVDECLRRLIGIRHAGQLEITTEMLLIILQKHFSLPVNVRIRGARFDPYSNTVSFLLEGDGFPPVPEAAEPELISFADGWLDGWDKRVKITIKHNNITAPLSNFPLLIYLKSPSKGERFDLPFTGIPIFDEIGANSLKIAVTESDGITECYVEVEKWDLKNEQAWLWVKVPAIASDVNTDLYLYYDNDHVDNTDKVGVPNSDPAENVWDDCVFVSHMRDDPDISNTRHIKLFLKSTQAFIIDISAD